MKGPRRTQTLPDDVAMKMDGFGGLLKRHANTALTVLLLFAAGFLFVRWRMRSAETDRQTIAGYIGNARESLQSLRTGQFTAAPVSDKDPRFDKDNPHQLFPMAMSPDQAISSAAMKQAEVEKYVSDALNASSIDERTRLQALQIRGDLYWTLANLPQMPDAASVMSHRYAETPDAYLGKALDAYTEVAAADSSKYAEEVDGAKLSLADIAVEKGDWAGAQKQMQAIADDSNAPEFLRDEAKSQIASIPAWKKEVVMLPAATTNPVDAGPTTTATTLPQPTGPKLTPTAGPFFPAGTGVPSTMPTTLPAVLPTTLPVVMPTSLPTVTPVTLPAMSVPVTKPAH